MEKTVPETIPAKQPVPAENTKICCGKCAAKKKMEEATCSNITTGSSNIEKIIQDKINADVSYMSKG